MDALAIEFISAFAMPPVPLITLAAQLGCQHVTVALEPIGVNPDGFAPYSLKSDTALRRETKAAIRDTGVTISVGEGLMIAPDVDAGSAYLAELEIIADLGAQRINTVSFEMDVARAFDQLGRLAEAASGFGIKSMIEYAPTFGIADLATARAAVRHVGRPDFGLLVDTMHTARSGTSIAELAAVPADEVSYIQLCDVPREPAMPNYLDEAMYERRGPGDGELPLREMLEVLPAGRIVGLEIPMRAKAEAGIGPRERLRPAVAATRALLAEVANGRAKTGA